MGDAAIDNFKFKRASLENVVKTQAMVDIVKAELNNNTSANKTSFNRKVLNECIETFGIKQVYNSTSEQIKIQKQLIETRISNKVRRNKLIIDLFVAIFTGASLYKAIMEAKNSSGGWDWASFAIFLVCVLIAVGIVIINHFGEIQKEK